MKKLVLASALMMAFGMNAYASDSVDLKVTGTLTLTACNPTFENGGVIDLGHIPIGNMTTTDNDKAYEAISVQHKKMDLTITCTADTAVGFTITDNNEGTIPASLVTDYSGAYGFGKTADDKAIGLYQLYENAETIDGAAANLIYSGNDGQNWSKARALNHINTLYSFANQDELTPKSGKTFNLKMDTTYYFEKSVADSVTDELDFQGSTTFSLVYL
ncbi:DUF1120 domain-containing protein [Cronobacter sakazakii]|uniref:DUF1120 domain-containing protein n=1 Tax=Cronobacter sakazakii TaxID=28141 RepID=UPI00020F2D01|nr:DUF1120 domain-containing protein [Cronobacter sakazakii]EGL73594.1 hypothetical protein CSE899_05232 [Cronobacter sakazakii E899]MDK1222741.1 DUF1120 domain-containing protein [Cronobacter turicensis]EGT0040287.1 DUF1120 domain-containing protein [Cronobacter sakazakii]EGT4239757.1 DUF1120 domain-containing protein [Cronobacter sakazakii]EGT4261560.1 DUF1120 domain-containing protein [Cronobacter sakazakii]